MMQLLFFIGTVINVMTFMTTDDLTVNRAFLLGLFTGVCLLCFIFSIIIEWEKRK